MDNLKNTLIQLKGKGYRFSAVRNLILTSLDDNKRPLSVSDFQQSLKLEKISANKTTIYRELDSLKKEGIILELQLKGNKRWYELSSRDHHHHIICVDCDKVGLSHNGTIQGTELFSLPSTISIIFIGIIP